MLLHNQLIVLKEKSVPGHHSDNLKYILTGIFVQCESIWTAPNSNDIDSMQTHLNSNAVLTWQYFAFGEAVFKIYAHICFIPRLYHADYNFWFQL